MLPTPAARRFNAPRARSPFFRRRFAKVNRSRRCIPFGRTLLTYFRRSRIRSLVWSRRNLFRKAFLHRGIVFDRGCGILQCPYRNEFGSPPRHQRTNSKNKGQQAAADQRSRQNVVLLLFIGANGAKSAAGQKVPFHTLDFLAAIAAKIWLIEHRRAYSHPPGEGCGSIFVLFRVKLFSSIRQNRQDVKRFRTPPFVQPNFGFPRLIARVNLCSHTGLFLSRY